MCSDVEPLLILKQKTISLNPTLDWICALTQRTFEPDFYTNMRLNPTLDWICALTSCTSGDRNQISICLNPTLDWICALTLVGLTLCLTPKIVLILLWTGYVL